MQCEETDVIDTSDEGTQNRVTARERFNNEKALVLQVIRGYVVLAALPAMAAGNINPEMVSRSQKWTPQSAAFKIDVENATEKALAGRPDLHDAWFGIASGETVSPELTRELVVKCGRIYAARGLSPFVYFQRVTK
jgi:hypothetical protein